jgi:hypothetical protein
VRAVFGLFLVSLSAWAADPPLSQSGTPYPSDPANPDIPNFREVNCKIFRGGRPTKEGLRQLGDRGVTTVIDLQGGDLNTIDPVMKAFWWAYEEGERSGNIKQEQEFVEKSLNGKFVGAPLNSHGKVTKKEDQQIDKILDMMCDPNSPPIFVHCQAGEDRTGLIIALYEVKCGGKTPDEAKKEWQDSGHTGIHQRFTGGLDKYFDQKAGQITQSGKAAPAGQPTANCPPAATPSGTGGTGTAR